MAAVVVVVGGGAVAVVIVDDDDDVETLPHLSVLPVYCFVTVVFVLLL